MKRILIVDDEKNMCTILKMLFEGEGFDVVLAYNGAEAIQRIEQGEVIDLIISDFKMPGGDGIGIMNHLKETERDIPLILITAYGTIPDAVQAVKKGAVDFITKPFNTDVIAHTVGRVFHTVELERSNQILSESIAEDRVICESPADAGDHGAGEEVRRGPDAGPDHGRERSRQGDDRQGHPRARVVPWTRAKSSPSSSSTARQFPRPSLKARSSATSAAPSRAREGLQGEGPARGRRDALPGRGRRPAAAIQPKLLRVLEDMSFQPVGSNTTIRVNARVICTTNQDLGQLVRKDRSAATCSTGSTPSP